MDWSTLALAAAPAAGKARNAVHTRESSEQASGGEVAFAGEGGAVSAAAPSPETARARRRKEAATGTHWGRLRPLRSNRAQAHQHAGPSWGHLCLPAWERGT